MNSRYFSKRLIQHLAVVFFAIVALNLAGCSSGSGPATSEENVITGTVTFTYNGAPLTDASKWPQSTNINDPFPGRIKIAFVPLDPTTRAPRSGPIAAIPGLGDIPGIPFSALRNGVYEFSSATARDANNNIIGSLPKDIYGVYVTYVNPFFTGQASQQFLNTGVVADLRSTSSVRITDAVEMRVAETLMQSGRTGTATLSGTVTATGNLNNWPPAPVGPPTAWTAGTEFIALFGLRDGAQGPGFFQVLGRPASGNSVTYAINIPMGTYRNVVIARYRVNPAAPGGFETVATLAEFRHPQHGRNEMTMDAGNRQAVWNVTISL
ncbi:MAG: hypothetical protein RMI34_02880 [Chloroherpetonaceae bacterium]|nr:hypothetical protein [Chloroherpetonaceae bacterium]MDW8019001.1 hypothetical protein [Chloroherpetonaceae bacterium]